jgi:hypothetical protein
MIIAVIALIFWRRRAPYLPRPPGTVAAVASYVSDSRMLNDLEGCEYLTTLELSRKVIGLRKKYVYGKRVGSDGQNRYLVDEDLTAVY